MKLWEGQVGHGIGLQPALCHVERLLQVASPQMNCSQTAIRKRAQIQKVQPLREFHGPLCMQHRLVELPELGKGERCHGLGVAVGPCCSGLLENPQWLEQPRGDLLWLEANVALEEVDGCAIGAEV